MFKKIKNRDIENILACATRLADYPMPGDLAFAIVSVSANLKRASDAYHEAFTQIGEKYCDRDDMGKPLSAFQKDANNQDLVAEPRRLMFKDATTEAAAIEELRKLEEQEVEIGIGIFDVATIAALKNITASQMEAITALVEITYKK